MLHTSFRLGLIALVAISGGAVAAANSNQTSPIACGVNTVSDRGMMSVEGILQSQTALTGEYRFSLRSQSNGGSSNISQGGGFSADAGATITLGKVMVSPDSHLNIDFEVSAGGKKYDCSQPLTTRT